MQNDICKAFYKKLPKNNKFTDSFMAKTKRKTKETGKDTISKMRTRLVVMLGEARQMIKDAEDMGGLDFVFESKLTPTEGSFQLMRNLQFFNFISKSKWEDVRLFL